MYSVQLVTSDGTLQSIVLSIAYFERDDISLYRNTGDEALVLGVDWDWDTDTTVRLLNGPEPAGTDIMIRRMTDKDRAYNIYDGGAAFSRASLDENFLQLIYLAQEFTEGSGLTGLYRTFDMNGYRIINLGDPVDDTDAVTKRYVDDYNDEQDSRLATLENTFVSSYTTSTIPYQTVLTTATDTITPGFVFDKAYVYVNGSRQMPERAFIVVDNTIIMAEELPVGTEFEALLGEDVNDATGLVTMEQFNVQVQRIDAIQVDLSAFNTRLTAEETKVQPIALGGTGNTTGNAVSATKLATARGVLTQLSSASAATFDGTADISPGVTGTLPIANGGTGNTAGRAATATKLDVPRGIRTNLASTSAVNFDGSADVTPGVTGILPIANGGTGRATGAAAIGVNSDITQLTGLTAPSVLPGVSDGSSAAAGKVGEYMDATSTAAAITSNTVANLGSLVLTAGDWDVSGHAEYVLGSGTTGASMRTGTSSSVAFAGLGSDELLVATLTAASTQRQATGTLRVSVATTTTMYLVGQLGFSGGTATARGVIRARRVR